MSLDAALVLQQTALHTQGYSEEKPAAGVELFCFFYVPSAEGHSAAKESRKIKENTDKNPTDFVLFGSAYCPQAPHTTTSLKGFN